MARLFKHSSSLRQDVLLLFDEGLTATQVAKIINKRFKSETLGNLSKCAALGIKWRADKYEKNNYSYDYPSRKPRQFKNEDEVSIDRLQTALRG
tara:strand:- start:32 stop:313 length:282 start_codon:yes stop_codon:yes gene_type:complete